MYEKIFGSKPKEYQGQSQLKMLNGYTPFFTSFTGDAYEQDTVRTAVDAIARNGAKLKPKHIRRTADGMQKADSNLEQLLQVRPNPYMDAYSFYYKVITQWYLKNNAFIYIQRDAFGTVRGLYPLLSSTVELLEVSGEMFARFNFMGGQTVVLPYTDLIHLRRFFYKHDIYGETSDAALTPALNLVTTTNQGIVNAIKSSASLRGILKFTSMMKREDLIKQRDDFMKDYMSINNDGGVAATDGKFDYTELKSTPMMINATQMKLIEEKVYKYFNVNASIVMSDYSEQQWASFYESVLEPISLQLSLEFTAKLFTTGQKGFGNEIVFEANRLQYATNATKISVVTLLMDRGLLSKNDALEIFNLPPIDGGEMRIMSLNFIDASKANEYQVGKGDGSGNQDGKTPNGDQGSSGGT
jgi:HK97 family phage portal protein